VIAPTLLLYIALVLCAVFIAMVVVRYDLHEREPWPLIVLAIALGAGGMWTAGQIQLEMIQAINRAGELVSNTMLAWMAGTTEEIAKLGVVAFVILFARRHFNEPIDGLIYGSFAGLGAALEESFFVLRHVNEPTLTQFQEPVRLAGHLLMGGIGGFGTGLVAVRSRYATIGIALSLGAAVVLHALWDMAAFDATDHFRIHDRLLVWHTIVPIGLMFGGMAVYRVLVRVGTSWTRTWLEATRAG